MTKSIEKNSFEWTQLVCLSAVHFIIDIFAGMLVVIMPAMQARFSISLLTGITLITVLNLTCNFVQVFIGHVRENKTSPLLLPSGLVLLAFICLIPALPRQPVSAWLSIPLIILTATGVAITHPEALRAVHSLKKLRPSTTSLVFLNTGYLGYAVGGYIAALLISVFGFKGLYLLGVLPAIGFAVVYLSRVRLAVEEKEISTDDKMFVVDRVSFLSVLLMAVPATAAPIILCAMLPQQLNRLGFELTFGGFTVLCFMGGSIGGAFFWGWFANKKGELPAIIISLFCGIPFLLAYLFFIHSRGAVWLLFMTGFCSGSSYPFIVTLARYARGFNLGRRMGLAVGGAWGISSLILWALGPLAQSFGIMKVLWLVPFFYLFCAMIGIFIKHSIKTKTLASPE